MAILFRPHYPLDSTLWQPLLQEALSAHDFRIWPNQKDPEEITYLIGRGLMPGDKTRWRNIRAVLSLSTGVNQYVGHPEFPHGAKLVRMIEPGLAQGMIEYVTAYVLRLHKHLDDYDDMQRRRMWPEYTGLSELASECVVGVAGLGEMGTPCAKALAALGFQVRGWSRSVRGVAGVRCYAGAEQLPEFLKGLDILVILLPLTRETRGMFGREHLGLMRPGAALINAARGPLVVEADLLDLLGTGQIGRAVLDVFDREPLVPEHPYWTHPRVIITPHIAAETRPRTGTKAIKDAIAALEDGREPLGLVDLSRGY